jgi:ubiquinone/menaquinone biosynthesis C-methylase UbiE
MMFDHVATTYDQSFTHSEIGKLQRASVMAYMDTILPVDKSLRILELNCGTGEDAVYFAKKGHHITATDLSEEMVEVTRQKITDKGLGKLAEIFSMDIQEISRVQFKVEFDLVFSNFGGLNCLSALELKKLSDDLVSVLKPGGRLVAVIMPKNCLWENLYFMAKLEWGKVFRRNTNQMLPVNVGTHDIPTWYFSPSEIAHILRPNFEKVAQKPIGFTVPPSYMEPFFAKRKRTLKMLGKMENELNRISGLAPFSDHFLIDLLLK